MAGTALGPVIMSMWLAARPWHDPETDGLRQALSSDDGPACRLRVTSTSVLERLMSYASTLSVS